MSRVLVTGATGFLGGHLCAELLRRGREVVPFARSLGGDVRRRESLEAAMAGCDAVVNLATLGVGASAADPAAGEAVNHDGVTNVIAAMRTAGVQRLLHASTAHALRPQTAYGRSKAAAEREVTRASDLQATVLRFPVLFGPGRGTPAPGNVVTAFRTAARDGSPLVLHGDPDRPIDLYPVVHAARRCADALDRPDTAGRTIDIGTGRGLPLRQLAALVRDAVGSRSEVRRDAAAPFVDVPLLDPTESEGLLGPLPVDLLAELRAFAAGP